MKLVVFGLTVSSSWGNGHATLWRGLIKALVRRGHRVVFFERDVPYYAGARDLGEIPGWCGGTGNRRRGKVGAGLEHHGLETRGWNGMKSAFADWGRGLRAPSQTPPATLRGGAPRFRPSPRRRTSWLFQRRVSNRRKRDRAFRATKVGHPCPTFAFSMRHATADPTSG